MNRYLSLGCVAIVLLCCRASLAYDAFNNFGPSDAYDPSTGWAVTGGDYAPFIPHIQAARFTSEATGTLAVIRIALHNSFHVPPGFNQVDVRLHDADLAGNIGPIIAAFTRGGLPASGPMDPPMTITSFDPAVNLITGNRYWIVVAPGDHSTDAVWNWNPGMGGSLAGSTDGGLSYLYFGGRMGAMRIEVIPEPASLAMLAIGVVGLALRRRR